MIAVATMDCNAEILREILHLRDMCPSWKGGDEVHFSLPESLEVIVDIIIHSNNVLYNIASYRERKWQEYANGLSYNEVKKLKIINEKIYEHISVPRMDQIPNTRMTHILFEWCTYQPFWDHWMDKWYMVFNVPPHKNWELSLYFIWKLYEDFVLDKYVNYFDILGFHDIDMGMPKNKPNVRNWDANWPIPPACI